MFDNGTLKRYYKNGKIEEYMYLHMQARKMKVNIDTNSNIYKIIPNSFDKFDREELKNIKKIKIKHFNIHYFRHRFKNLINKIKKKVM